MAIRFTEAEPKAREAAEPAPAPRPAARTLRRPPSESEAAPALELPPEPGDDSFLEPAPEPRAPPPVVPPRRARAVARPPKPPPEPVPCLFDDLPLQPSPRPKARRRRPTGFG